MPASHSATQAHQPGPQVPTKYKECFLDKNPKLRDAPTATSIPRKRRGANLAKYPYGPFLILRWPTYEVTLMYIFMLSVSLMQ